jgi:hypothetical protein
MEDALGGFADEVLVTPAPERRPLTRTAQRRESPTRTVKTDWPRDLRSETYLNRLWRMFAKRAAIALAVFVALYVVMMGASLLPGLLTPSVLPAPPKAPAPLVAGIAPLQRPLSDAATPHASAVPLVADSSEYLVAVGFFVSRDRADRLVDALTRAGLPAMQRPFQLRRQQVQQIVLGPFFSRSEAVADLRRLQELGGYDDATVMESRRAPIAQ